MNLLSILLFISLLCTLYECKGNKFVWFDGKNPVSYSSFPESVNPVAEVALDSNRNGNFMLFLWKPHISDTKIINHNNI